jgi:HKD family nuclease
MVRKACGNLVQVLRAKTLGPTDQGAPGQRRVRPTKRCSGRDVDVNVQLLTPAARGAYLERIQHDIERAEHFVLVTAFATSDGIALLEPAMCKCLEAGGQGTLVLALDRQHFNAADVFEKLASLVESFPDRLEVRIVRERAGLLHAKAVFAKLPDGTATLLVGSANLTERAFTQNHELGLWVNLLGEPEVSRAFQLFAQSLGGTRHDAADLHCLAGHLGIPPHVVRPPGHRPEPTLTSWEDLIGSNSGAPPQPISIETFVGDWLQAGSIVGRGRRGLDVLVIRTPGEHLEHLGLIHPKARKRIASATDRIFSAGFGVRLLPDKEDERLRKDARRTQNILGKLTLNLPCFGLWMPSTYWDLFQQAVAKVQAAGISTEAIRAAATRRGGELDGAGIEGIECQIDAIVADFKHSGLAKPGREADLRAELLVHFRAQLAQRTPEVVARAVGFRTQRQALASDLDLRAIARSFFVDLVQSTFAATYRTGGWPRLFKSFVGRELAARIAKRLLAAGEEPSDDLALRLLDGTARWEDEGFGFEKVTAEVNKLIGEADDFVPLTMEELLHADQAGGGDTDDDRLE